MIRTWRHKGLKKFYDTGNTAGIQTKHHAILQMLLFQLDASTQPQDMNTPGNGFHALSGKLKGYFSVKVNANWRLIFKFDRENVIDVDYIDYH